MFGLKITLVSKLQSYHPETTYVYIHLISQEINCGNEFHCNYFPLMCVYGAAIRRGFNCTIYCVSVCPLCTSQTWNKEITD